MTSKSILLVYYLCVDVTEYLTEIKKDLFWLVVIEVPVCGLLTPSWLGQRILTVEAHGRKGSHLMVKQKAKKGE